LYLVDLFDFIPIVPPGMPGDSRERSTEHQFASGVGSVLLPIINFVIVLVAAFAHDATIALALMPGLSALVLFVLARRLSVDVAWSLVLAGFCAVFCFVANVCALFLAAMMQFYRDF
jgi:hypothetical protein